jgi:hypothetical protein
MSNPDNQKQLRILMIKKWVNNGYTFLEIVAMYNAEFGTKHFNDILP